MTKRKRLKRAYDTHPGRAGGRAEAALLAFYGQLHLLPAVKASAT